MGIATLIWIYMSNSVVDDWVESAGRGLASFGTVSMALPLLFHMDPCHFESSMLRFMIEVDTVEALSSTTDPAAH